MGGTVNVLRAVAKQVQIDRAIPATGGQGVEIPTEGGRLPDLPDAGGLLRLIGLQPAACPALCHGIARQDVKPLPDGSGGVLPGDKNGILLLNAGHIHKIPVCEERIILVPRFTDFRAGEQHQQGVALHGFVETGAVAFVKFAIHVSHLRQSKYGFCNEYTSFRRLCQLRKPMVYTCPWP